jgi:hypothetical protein
MLRLSATKELDSVDDEWSSERAQGGRSKKKGERFGWGIVEILGGLL